MDGENTTLYRDGFHARSVDGRQHPSRSWLAGFHASLAHNIPPGWRICGENVYARHAIGYRQLPSYFLGFSVWDEHNRSLSWDRAVEVLEGLGIQAVPVLHRGRFDVAALGRIARGLDTKRQEGFVVRLADAFGFDDFDRAVAKWVRKGHVQTTQHWMQSEIVPNRLAERPSC